MSILLIMTHFASLAFYHFRLFVLFVLFILWMICCYFGKPILDHDWSWTLQGKQEFNWNCKICKHEYSSWDWYAFSPCICSYLYVGSSPWILSLACIILSFCFLCLGLYRAKPEGWSRVSWLCSYVLFKRKVIVLTCPSFLILYAFLIDVLSDASFFFVVFHGRDWKQELRNRSMRKLVRRRFLLQLK